MTQPLTDDEFGQLEAFLDAAGPRAMNLESLDGFFAALICSPDMVPPSEYLSQIWGEDFSFESEEQAAGILGLLMRHWNTISGTLNRTLAAPDVYLPVLLKGEDGVACGNDWAQGFLRGIGLRAGRWSDMLDEEHCGPLFPMMLLAHEHDPDPALRPRPVTPEQREELLMMMIAGLTKIYRHFEPQRRPHSQSSLKQTQSKVGRNAPCPCGSGKKYKRCCAETERTLH